MLDLGRSFLCFHAFCRRWGKVNTVPLKHNQGHVVVIRLYAEETMQVGEYGIMDAFSVFVAVLF